MSRAAAILPRRRLTLLRSLCRYFTAAVEALWWVRSSRAVPKLALTSISICSLKAFGGPVGYAAHIKQSVQRSTKVRPSSRLSLVFAHDAFASSRILEPLQIRLTKRKKYYVSLVLPALFKRRSCQTDPVMPSPLQAMLNLEDSE